MSGWKGTACWIRLGHNQGLCEKDFGSWNITFSLEMAKADPYVYRIRITSDMATDLKLLAIWKKVLFWLYVGCDGSLEN